MFLKLQTSVAEMQICALFISQSLDNTYPKQLFIFYFAILIIFLNLSLFAPSIAFPATPLSSTSDFILPSPPSTVNHNQPISTSDRYLPSFLQSVNQSAWARTITCNPGPGIPLDEFPCLRAITKILVQTGSANIETFGTEGTYTGPRTWAWATCEISIDVSHVRALRNSLLVFAISAASIMDHCNKPGSLYYGGTCDFTDRSGGSQYLGLKMASVPNSLSSVPNIPSPPSPANAMALQTEKIECSDGLGDPVFDLDCLVVIDQMLLQYNSATIYRFGRLSTYSGPREWAYHSCRTSLWENPDKMYIGSIAEFTTFAASISSECSKPEKVYHGGTWASLAASDGTIVVRVKVSRNNF